MPLNPRFGFICAIAAVKLHPLHAGGLPNERVAWRGGKLCIELTNVFTLIGVSLGSKPVFWVL